MGAKSAVAENKEVIDSYTVQMTKPCIRLVVLLFAAPLSACSSSSESSPEPQTPPSVTEPEAAPSVEPQAVGACQVHLIRRAGLDAETPACAEAVARLEQLPSTDIACNIDADCAIFQAASGCLGVNLAVEAHDRTEPVPQACVMDDMPCGTADFSDHQIECQNSCCVIYEE